MPVVKVTKKTKEIEANICDLPNALHGALQLALAAIGIEIVEEEKRLEESGKHTGRTYNGIQSSAVGEVPAKRTGKLSDSTGYKVSGPMNMAIGQTEEYAVYLAEGTHDKKTGKIRIKPRANLLQAIHNKAVTAGLILQEHIERELE